MSIIHRELLVFISEENTIHFIKNPNKGGIPAILIIVKKIFKALFFFNVFIGIFFLLVFFNEITIDTIIIEYSVR